MSHLAMTVIVAVHRADSWVRPGQLVQHLPIL